MSEKTKNNEKTNVSNKKVNEKKTEEGRITIINKTISTSKPNTINLKNLLPDSPFKEYYTNKLKGKLKIKSLKTIIKRNYISYKKQKIENKFKNYLTSEDEKANKIDKKQKKVSFNFIINNNKEDKQKREMIMENHGKIINFLSNKKKLPFIFKKEFVEDNKYSVNKFIYLNQWNSDIKQKSGYDLSEETINEDMKKYKRKNNSVTKTKINLNNKNDNLINNEENSVLETVIYNNVIIDKKLKDKNIKYKKSNNKRFDLIKIKNKEKIKIKQKSTTSIYKMKKYSALNKIEKEHDKLEIRKRELSSKIINKIQNRSYTEDNKSENLNNINIMKKDFGKTIIPKENKLFLNKFKTTLIRTIDNKQNIKNKIFEILKEIKDYKKVYN
jgi:hypothetical protein